MKEELITEPVEEVSHPYVGDTLRADVPVMREQWAEKQGEKAQQVEELIQTLKRENDKKVGRFFTAMILLAIATGVLLARLHIPDFTGISYLPSVALASAFASTRLQKRAARKLAQIDDLRAVGALLDTMGFQDKQTERAVGAALTRLLPRLRQSDGDLLSDSQRMTLYKSMANSKAEFGAIRLGESPGMVLGARWSAPAKAYVLAALAAVEQIGDGKAVPFVEKLAEGKSWAKRYPDVRERARQILPLLQERLTAEQLRDRLLRPAIQDAGQPDSLLRPAEFAPSDDAHLLRPAPQNQVN